MNQELINEFVAEIRNQVTHGLDSGLEAADIAFTLSYVATEIGLQMTDNSSETFPLLFEAMSTAVNIHNDPEFGDSLVAGDVPGSIH